MAKRKHYHVADNTVLDCSSVNYRYNRDTYIMGKNIYWFLSFVGFVTSFCVIILSSDSIVQIIAGAFMGGILSLFVWLFTIRQQDKMNYEIANIDMHIMRIDEILELQQSKTKFINPEEEELVDADCKDVGLRFLLLLQILTLIYGDSEIDTESMKLKFLNGEELLIKDFIEKSEEILVGRRFRVVAPEDEWDKLVKWNNWYLDWQLNELKRKLQRYKYYILCGNAPENYSKLKMGINDEG